SFAVRARDHRGLGGDLQAEGDLRRTRLRAEAQRRMAAERLSCLARNGRSPGEESLTAVVAAQAIEPQPSFGQIKPSEAGRLATEEKTWRISNNLHKRPATSGDGKETLAYRWVGHCTSRPRPHSAPIAHGIASARDAVSVPSKRCDDRPTVTR